MVTRSIDEFRLRSLRCLADCRRQNPSAVSTLIIRQGLDDGFRTNTSSPMAHSFGDWTSCLAASVYDRYKYCDSKVVLKFTYSAPLVLADWCAPYAELTVVHFKCVEPINFIRGAVLADREGY
jgi:hypothetical protein